MKRTLIAAALFTALNTSAIASDNDWKDDTKDAWIDGKAEATLLFNTKLNSFDINTDVLSGKVTLTGEVENEAEKQLAEELVRGIDGVIDVDNSLTFSKTDVDDMDDEFRTVMSKDMNEAKDKSHNAMTKDMDGIKDKSHSAMTNDMDGVKDNSHTAMTKEMDSAKDKSHSAMNKNMDDMDGMDDMDDVEETMAISDAKIVTVLKSRLLDESEVTGTDIDVDVDNRVVTLKGNVKSETERQLVVSIAENTDDVDSVKDMLTVKPESK